MELQHPLTYYEYLACREVEHLEDYYDELYSLYHETQCGKGF